MLLKFKYYQSIHDSQTKKIEKIKPKEAWLKDTGSLWMTANIFGLYQFTVSKTLIVVCDIINIVLGLEYLHLHA